MTFPEAVASLGAAASLCFLAYLYQRSEWHKRELAHAERLKALEAGRPLPDAEIARAGRDGARTVAAALVAIFVTLFLLGAAVGGTALVQARNWTSYQLTEFLTLTCVIWSICGLLALLNIILSLKVLLRPPERLSGPGLVPTSSAPPAPERPLDPRDINFGLEFAEKKS